MVGKIIALVSCLLCAVPFLIISIYNKDSKEPINFWSGDTSLKEKVADIKGYNKEMALLYLCFDCTLGIFLMYRVYKKILKRYSYDRGIE